MILPSLPDTDTSPVDAIAAPKPDAADELFTFRREDLAVLTADYIRQHRSPGQWAGAIAGLGGFVLCQSLIWVGSERGWPESLAPVFFFSGWAILLACTAIVLRRGSRLRRKYQFARPVCEKALLPDIKDRDALSRVQLLGSTGACPHCSAQICSP